MTFRHGIHRWMTESNFQLHPVHCHFWFHLVSCIIIFIGALSFFNHHQQQQEQRTGITATTGSASASASSSTTLGEHDNCCLKHKKCNDKRQHQQQLPQRKMVSLQHHRLSFHQWATLVRLSRRVRWQWWWRRVPPLLLCLLLLLLLLLPCQRSSAPSPSANNALSPHSNVLPQRGFSLHSVWRGRCAAVQYHLPRTTAGLAIASRGHVHTANTLETEKNNSSHINNSESSPMSSRLWPSSRSWCKVSFKPVVRHANGHYTLWCLYVKADCLLCWWSYSCCYWCKVSFKLVVRHGNGHGSVLCFTCLIAVFCLWSCSIHSANVMADCLLCWSSDSFCYWCKVSFKPVVWHGNGHGGVWCFTCLITVFSCTFVTVDFRFVMQTTVVTSCGGKNTLITHRHSLWNGKRNDSNIKRL